MTIPVSIPPELQSIAHNHWASLLEACAAAAIAPPTQPEIKTQALTVFAVSEYVAESCVRYPQLLIDLIQNQALTTSRTYADYEAEFIAGIQTITTEPQLASFLRHWRRREMVRLIWRDLTGAADFVATTRELSSFTDVVLNGTAHLLQQWQALHLQMPLDEQQQPQQLHIIAFGKLGGNELNLSSDIDLMFLYPCDDERLKQSTIDTEQFFTRLAQKLIKILHEFTADGFVFRVDMRLRPFGNSGPLVMGFTALENYYQEQGRNWERYALSKARLVTRDTAHATRVNTIMRSFVYRRYVDFTAIDSLRTLKETISLEVKTKGLSGNIKRGPGGIREAEFISQTFRLIRGGQEPQLQLTNFLVSLDILVAIHLLDADVVNQLRTAYIFLRNLEHRLQAIADRQTQDLPTEPLDQARIAYAMNFENWPDFKKALDLERSHVSHHFANMLASPAQKTMTHVQDERYKQLLAFWIHLEDSPATHETLQQIGFSDSIESLRLLHELKESIRYRSMDHTSQHRLDYLMPLLLPAIGQCSDPISTLKRIIDLLHAILRRSAYLALLAENPMALEHLVSLCGKSPWLAEQLREYPLLLDDLLRTEKLYHPASYAQLDSTLRQGLLAIPNDDLEQQLNYLRRFKHSAMLHVAAAELIKALVPSAVSQHLCDIALLIVREVQQLSWQELVLQHGEPPHAEFAIIAYGKLGSFELNYTSDLDLVFLYEDNSTDQLTTGLKPLTTSEFYLRLCQRIINRLAMRTATGALYRVDTRLRPSGNAGLLVSTLKAFSEYQSNAAWTWEHQALVRARTISGTAHMSTAFTKVRADILCQPRDLAQLRSDVVNMRQRMRDNKSTSSSSSFDIKLDSGGLIDIEFIVQFCVLHWAHQHPSLVEFTDNIRLLNHLSDLSILTAKQSKFLIEAYLIYTQCSHQQALQFTEKNTNINALQPYRDGVQRIWHELFET